MKYQQRFDGEPFKIPLNKPHKISCCDCGLVHILSFKVKQKIITIKAIRDNRATAQRRRKLKKENLK